MKRFKYTRHFRSKIDTYVEFPITDLDMTPYTSNNNHKTSQIYDLYSIIVHHGTFGSGHYIAYLWSPDNASWFEMNDSHTKPTTPDNIHKQSAYMLFYLRRDVNSRLKDVDSLDMIADTLSSVSSVPMNTPFKNSNSLDETYYSSPADSSETQNETSKRRSGRLRNQSSESIQDSSSVAVRRSKRKRNSLKMIINSDSDS